MPQNAVIYLNYDNYGRFLLKMNGLPYDLVNITQMDLRLGERVVSSTNQAEDPIRWAQTDYQTGEMRLYLGFMLPALAPGAVAGYLVVYDADHLHGLVWNKIAFTVKEI